MTSNLASFVPVLTSASEYPAWAPAMENFLAAQGLWRKMLHSRPNEPIEATEAVPATRTTPAIPAVEGTDPDVATGMWDRIESWEENNSKALGSMRLRLHPEIAYQHREVLVAKFLWNELKDKFGSPGLTSIVNELRSALEIQINIQEDPTLKFEQFRSHFGRMAQMKVIVPEELQALIMVAKLPRSMAPITSAIMADNDIRLVTLDTPRGRDQTPTS